MQNVASALTRHRAGKPLVPLQSAVFCTWLDLQGCPTHHCWYVVPWQAPTAGSLLPEVLGSLGF